LRAEGDYFELNANIFVEVFNNGLNIYQLNSNMASVKLCRIQASYEACNLTCLGIIFELKRATNVFEFNVKQYARENNVRCEAILQISTGYSPNVLPPSPIVLSPSPNPNKKYLYVEDDDHTSTITSKKASKQDYHNASKMITFKVYCLLLIAMVLVI
jgi:hypothetical protein